MDSTTRFRIASRIHFALLRRYGEKVPIDGLLHDPAFAREALWVCEASGLEELKALAVQFKAAPLPDAPEASVQAPPEALGWSQDTSGFGVATLSGISGFADLDPTQTPARKPRRFPWFNGARRLRDAVP